MAFHLFFCAASSGRALRPIPASWWWLCRSVSAAAGAGCCPTGTLKNPENGWIAPSPSAPDGRAGRRSPTVRNDFACPKPVGDLVGWDSRRRRDNLLREEE